MTIYMKKNTDEISNICFGLHKWNHISMTPFVPLMKMMLKQSKLKGKVRFVATILGDK